ncbi:MAG TPA: tetratricopeptide repeat protein [Planctomycetota bacterium]|nr:tetratricopeptide repeat protein [Planctomycetota bacterium]
MLRHMERGRVADAGSALEEYEGGFVPPPHVLWHLGRQLFRRGEARQAKLALKLFLDLYPGHADRPQVLHDLARVLAGLGEREEARAILDEARRIAARA